MSALALAILVLKCLLLIGLLLAGFAYATLFERRIVARMQARLGPNRAGPWGLLQPLADGLKLIYKETVIPSAADRVLYLAAPVLSVVVAVLTFAVIPMADPLTVVWRGQPIVVTFQVAELNVALLYVLGISSLAVYGIAIGGWSSGSKYSVLGGLRSSAQLVSYELAMGLSLVGVVMLAGSLSVAEIVRRQETIWFVVLQPLGFAVYGIAALAETNRAPFDLPEAEQELTAGFHTEYSGMRFALFYMAEYISMITVSALAVSLFLGGYRLPCLRGTLLGVWCDLPWYGDLAVFGFKVLAGLFVFVWLRATLPRLRYDQLMRLGWLVLLPAALINIVCTAILLGLMAGRV